MQAHNRRHSLCVLCALYLCAERQQQQAGCVQRAPQLAAAVAHCDCAVMRLAEALAVQVDAHFHFQLAPRRKAAASKSVHKRQPQPNCFAPLGDLGDCCRLQAGTRWWAGLRRVARHCVPGASGHCLMRKLRQPRSEVKLTCSIAK